MKLVCKLSGRPDLTSSYKQGVQPRGKWRTLYRWNLGGEKSLEILYRPDVMQPPVGHDQTAYSTGMLRHPNGKEVFLSDGHIHVFFSLLLGRRLSPTKPPTRNLWWRPYCYRVLLTRAVAMTCILIIYAYMLCLLVRWCHA